ncbi:hypothetical protein [Kribbella sp. NPDC049584]|uniref:hypothetical protein n=1 Tax=Kribbella sp. NPDC049584 TaxID=3154833 RepID=UPI0034143B6E
MTDARSAHSHSGVGICDPLLRPPGRDPRGAQASVGVSTSGPRGGEPFDAALVGSLFSSTVPGTVGFEEKLVHRPLRDAAEPCAPNGLDDVRELVGNQPVDRLRALGPAHVVPRLAEAFTS